MSGEQHKGYDPTNPNSGHGWLNRRPDGLRVKCGGLAICEVCKADQARADGHHHPGKQRAVAALQSAGYETDDPAQRAFYRRLGESAQIIHEQDRFLLTGRLKDLPTLLNPITKERAEKAKEAVMAELDGHFWEREEMELGKALQSLIDRLFPEEAPADANPG